MKSKESIDALHYTLLLKEANSWWNPIERVRAKAARKALEWVLE